MQTKNHNNMVNLCATNKLTLNDSKTEAMWMSGGLKIKTENKKKFAQIDFMSMISEIEVILFDIIF